MNNLQRKKILHSIQKIIINAELSEDEIDYMISTIKKGDFGKSLLNILISIKSVRLYDDSFYGNNLDVFDFNEIARNIKIKNIPINRVIAFMNSLGFYDIDDCRTLEEAIERFLNHSNKKNSLKFVEFVDLYTGSVDPYLNEGKNENK